jgi:hypothetical protein
MELQYINSSIYFRNYPSKQLIMRAIKQDKGSFHLAYATTTMDCLEHLW